MTQMYGQGLKKVPSSCSRQTVDFSARQVALIHSHLPEGELGPGKLSPNKLNDFKLTKTYPG